MLVYLNDARDRWSARLQRGPRENVRQAVIDGAPRRVRPVTMTESAALIGMMPIRIGISAEVMQRIATPVVGGVFRVWIAALATLPVVFYLWHARVLPASRSCEEN